MSDVTTTTWRWEASLRVLYHGLIPETQDASSYWQSRRRHLAQVAGPDVKVEWCSLDPAYYETMTPAELARCELGEAVQSLAIARAVASCDPATYDVVALGIVQDSGLEVCRTLVDKPVVGYGQAAMLASRFVSHRVGLLLFNGGLAPVVEERLGQHVPGHLVATEIVDVTYDEVLGAFDGGRGAALVEPLTAACRRLVEAGAEAVVPGQMLLAEALWALGVRSVSGVSVVDGLAATLWMARAQAGLWQAGLRPPAHGFHWSSPPDAVRRWLAEAPLGPDPDRGPCTRPAAGATKAGATKAGATKAGATKAGATKGAAR